MDVRLLSSNSPSFDLFAAGEMDQSLEPGATCVAAGPSGVGTYGPSTPPVGLRNSSWFGLDFCSVVSKNSRTWKIKIYQSSDPRCERRGGGWD